jgi:hypothetical protein
VRRVKEVKDDAASLDFLATRARNATIGRDLPRQCVDAGLPVRSVEPIAVLFRDFGTADQILSQRRKTARR